MRLLIEQHPLAWLCAGGGTQACLLPLVGVFGDDNTLTDLIGHCAVANPLVEAVHADPRVTVLINGPQGYISPSDVGRRNWGPTWNYAQVHVTGTISVDPQLTTDALDLLIAKVESGRPEPWGAHELGDRYGSLVSRIVGFRIRVDSLIPRFKLGQDENLPDLLNILANLPDGALRNWMLRCNRGRLPEGEAGDAAI